MYHRRSNQSGSQGCGNAVGSFNKGVERIKDKHMRNVMMRLHVVNSYWTTCPCRLCQGATNNKQQLSWHGGMAQRCPK